MLDLFEVSFNATSQYVANRIESLKNRIIYEKTCDEISKVQGNQFTDNLQELRSVLIKNETPIIQLPKAAGITSGNYRKYSLMAYEHAIDIIDSITTRFITGGSSYYSLYPLKELLKNELRQTDKSKGHATV